MRILGIMLFCMFTLLIGCYFIKPECGPDCEEEIADYLTDDFKE